jgi:hypothetical protein
MEYDTYIKHKLNQRTNQIVFSTCLSNFYVGFVGGSAYIQALFHFLPRSTTNIRSDSCTSFPDSLAQVKWQENADKIFRWRNVQRELFTDILDDHVWKWYHRIKQSGHQKDKKVPGVIVYIYRINFRKILFKVETLQLMNQQMGSRAK